MAVLLLAAVPPASAHSPSDMKLVYNGGTGTLDVIITHIVADPEGHYVRDIFILVNGENVREETYIGQPSPDTFSYTFEVPAPPGSTIGVTASCVLGGSISRTVTVSGQAGDGGSQESLPANETRAAGWPLIPLAATALYLAARKFT